MYGNRLRELRQKQGYSQELLAELLNIGNKQIWRYENGETKPDGETVAKIARLLETSTDYLLGLTEDPAPPQMRELSQREQAVITAWRRGEIAEAIRGIVGE